MTPSPAPLGVLHRPLRFPRWARRPLAIAYGALMLFASGGIVFLIARDVSPFVALAWLALAAAFACGWPRLSRQDWWGLHLVASVIALLLSIAVESWWPDRTAPGRGLKPPISWFFLVWSLGGVYDLVPTLRRLWNPPLPAPPERPAP